MAVSVIEGILLFVLSIPIVMRHRILPIVGTPYWLFGILFFVLLAHLIICLYPSLVRSTQRLLRIKTVFLWGVITISLGGSLISSIVDRSKTAPIYGVHDIILQQEAAIRFLLEGKNPYTETYFGTPLEQWNYDELGSDAINPALYHFVMPPWYLLFPLPFYFFSIPILGYFDARMVLLFCIVGTLFVLSRFFKDRSISSLAIMFTALSPATVDYIIEGRSDIFAIFWLVLSLYLLENKRLIFASLVFALAILSKQSIWIATPFFLYYLVINKKTIKPAMVSIGVMLAVVLLVAGPFLLWDVKSLASSVIFYLSGNTANSYPVSGYGLSMILYEFGIIKDIHAYYPFASWQIIFGLPILGASLVWFAKKPSMSRVLIGYGVVLFAIWYTSRYFNNSHVGYLSWVFTIGALKHLDEKEGS